MCCPCLYGPTVMAQGSNPATCLLLDQRLEQPLQILPNTQYTLSSRGLLLKPRQGQRLEAEPATSLPGALLGMG